MGWFRDLFRTKMVGGAVTKESLGWYIEHDTCPDCKKKGFWEGPRGGININIFCKNPECRSGFNIAVFGGELIFAERIHKGEDEYYK